VTAYLCYAGGFAAGNFVGMWLEDRLALGTLVLRVIIPEDGEALAQKIHEAGFGVTHIDGQGAAGPVKLIHTIVKRRHVKQVLSIIHETSPNAFMSIEEVRSTEKGIFPSNLTAPNTTLSGRKSK
jgi:uncharacterized protein YebE (UPF0316 family)